ncbi:MAG: hypothetical protein SOZ60_01630, partial [Prevotella sp.]|nr:hypothetical protein [Prevotella sp.]
MKRMILILTLMVMACSAAMSQQQPSMSLHVDGVEREGNGYRVRYSFTLPQPASDYSYQVTPLFTCGTDTVYEAPVTVRGKLNAKKLRRRVVLGDRNAAVPSYIPSGIDSIITRTAYLSTDRYPWVVGSTLRLCTSVEGEGCCEVSPAVVLCCDSFLCERPFHPVFSLVEDNTGKAGELQRNNPVLQHISQYRPYDSTRILRKEEGALYVFFPLDKWTLLHDFRDNAATLDTIVSITRQIMADSTSSVKLIQIIGLASPEGSVKRNNLLGQNRAAALRDYIKQRVKTGNAMFELCNGGEAWTELRDQIADSNIEGRDQLLNIIDTEKNPDERERKMKHLNGGKTYRYLKDNVLSDQRNSGYIRIYY